MASAPAVCFAAYSGTGKTTFLEDVIRHLKRAGLRVAVIKHAGRIDFDESKDSARYLRAGADTSAVVAHGIAMTILNREPSLTETADRLPEADLILVEGYRNEPVTQIGMCRQATGKGFPDPLERYVAVVTDLPLDTALPCFSFSDAEKVADFLILNRDRFTRLGCGPEPAAGR